MVKIVKEKGLTIKRDAVLIGPCRARQLKRVFFFKCTQDYKTVILLGVTILCSIKCQYDEISWMMYNCSSVFGLLWR